MVPNKATDHLNEHDSVCPTADNLTSNYYNVECREFFNEVIYNDFIHLRRFRKLCYTGIPSECRIFAYKVLLEVYKLDLHEHSTIDAQNYRKYRKALCSINGDSGTFNNSTDDLLLHCLPKYSFPSLHNLQVKYPVDQQTVNQIFIDIKRIDNKYRIIDGVDYSYIYMNILLLTAAKRPYLGYIQGMCDLLVPFVIIYLKRDQDEIKIKTIIRDATQAINNTDSINNTDVDSKYLRWESEIFACFSGLLNNIQHNIYSFQNSLVDKTKRILKKTDKSLYNHLKRVDVDIHFLVFRWYNCLFIREFPINDWFRIFDSILSSDIDEFLVNYAISLLIYCRNEIITGDFGDVVSYMQNLQDKNINVYDLLGKAVFLTHEHNISE